MTTELALPMVWPVLVPRRQACAVALVASLLAGCGSDDLAAAIDAPTAARPDASARQVRLADVVVFAPGASGSGTGDPQNAVNGVHGAGASTGSTDVYSLGFGENNTITLGWSDDGVLVDGPGNDLAVFENAFLISGGPAVFMDLIIVEVSFDGTSWVAFPHDYIAPDPSVYSADPTLWVGFAGKTPVLLNDTTNPVDPFDAAAAGGDELDLATLPDDGGAGTDVRTHGARFVRLVTAPSQVNPDTGMAYVRATIANGADIDGIYGRSVVSVPREK